MYSIQLIRHKNIDVSTLDRVIALKQSAWPYPKESQQSWIQANLKDDDLHVILMEGDKDVAYLNLCAVHCEINGVETKCLGIGNVCSYIKGQGYGNKLMKYTNEWLKENNQTGLLFCHERVALFYEKCGWMSIDNGLCTIEGITPDVLIYAYNLSCPVNSIKYQDRLF